MVIQNYRDIKARAHKTLNYTPWDVKKLVLIFGLVSLCLGPVLTAIYTLIQMGSQQAQGISGLETFSRLETVSTMLSIAMYVVIMLWSPGILYCGLMLLREHDPWPKGLLRGFKKWGGIVKYTILVAAFVIVLVLAISPVATIISMPFMGEFTTFITEMPQTEAEMLTYMESVSEAQLTQMMLPMLLIMWGVALVVILPLSYRARMTQLIIMDEDRIGTREAIRFSFKLTKGSCWQLFRMDLSYWWYYILIAVTSSIPMAAMLPAFANYNETAVTLILNAVSAILGMGVYMLGLMKVSTAEAVAYDHLRTVIVPDAPQLPEGERHDI